MCHEALQSLFTSKEPKGRRARWLERLCEYEFDIVHREGRRHQNADVLSCLPELTPDVTDDTFKPEDSTNVTAATLGIQNPPLTCANPVLESLSVPELSMVQQADPDLEKVISWFDHSTGSFVRPLELVLE